MFGCSTGFKWFVLTLPALFHVGFVVAAVPHDFIPGTPAKADEVNENFQSLDQRLDNVDTGKPTFTLVSEINDPASILESFEYMIEDDVELGQLITSSRFSIFLDGEASQVLTPLVFKPGVRQSIIKFEFTKQFGFESNLLFSVSDTSGNISKLSLLVPKIETPFISGSYKIDPPLMLPVTTVDDEIIALNNKACYLTSNGQPTIDSLTLSQVVLGNGPALSLNFNGDAQLGLAIGFDSGTSSQFPFSNPQNFPIELGRQAGGSFGQTTTSSGGSVLQVSENEISFTISVVCDLNGNETTYDVSGSAILVVD